MENNTVDIHSFLEQFPKRPTKIGIYLPNNFPKKNYNLYLFAFLRYCAQPISNTLEAYLTNSTFNQIKKYLIQNFVYNEKQFNDNLKCYIELGLISKASAKELEANENGYAFNYITGKRFVKFYQRTLQDLLATTAKHQLAFSILCVFSIDWYTYMYYNNSQNYPFYTYKTLLEKINWPLDIDHSFLQLLSDELNFIFASGFATPTFSQQRFSRKQSPFQVMHIKNLNLSHCLIPSLNCQPQIAQLLKLTDCEDNTNV